MKNVFYLIIFILTYTINTANAQKVSVISGISYLKNINEQNLLSTDDAKKIVKNSFSVENTPIDAKQTPIATTDFTEKIMEKTTKNSKPRVEIGNLNYTKGYIEAKGKVYLNKMHVAERGLEYAKDMAKIGAEVDARANLLAIIMCVDVYDSIRIVDEIIQSRITIQTLKGAIKSRLVGTPIYGDGWVEVTMRTDLNEGEGSVYDFINKQKLLPEQIQISEVQKQEVLKQYLKALKEDGLVSDTATIAPPIVAEIPKNQVELYCPKLIPNISIDCNGRSLNLDMTKYQNSNNPKALAIVNATRSLIEANGVFKNTPVLNGYINNGNINIDLCDLAQKQMKNKKVAEVLGKMGSILIQSLPIVAMFI